MLARLRDASRAVRKIQMTGPRLTRVVAEARDFHVQVAVDPTDRRVLPSKFPKFHFRLTGDTSPPLKYEAGTTPGIRRRLHSTVRDNGRQSQFHRRMIERSARARLLATNVAAAMHIDVDARRRAPVPSRA